MDSDSGNVFVHKLNRNCLAPAIRISKQRFMRTSMLLITALVGVKQHAGVYFLPSSSDEHACGCVRDPPPPRAHRRWRRVSSLKSIGVPRLASQTPKWGRNFSEDARGSTKWWISCRRRVQRKRRSFAAALENASSALATSARFPPISSFAACLMGQSVQLTHRQ